MRMLVQSLAPFSGLTIQCCSNLRSQIRLGSGIAVAVGYASSHNSNSTLAQELPYTEGTAIKKKKKKSSPVVQTINKL